MKEIIVHLFFEDYSADELATIFRNILKKQIDDGSIFCDQCGEKIWVTKR